MAKATTKKVSSSFGSTSLTLPTAADKKEKQNGKRFLLEETYSGILLAVLPKDTILVECEDKWYQPYINGSRLFFRIGNTIMGKLKLREIVV